MRVLLMQDVQIGPGEGQEFPWGVRVPRDLSTDSEQISLHGRGLIHWALQVSQGYVCSHASLSFLLKKSPFLPFHSFYLLLKFPGNPLFFSTIRCSSFAPSEGFSCLELLLCHIFEKGEGSLLLSCHEQSAICPYIVCSCVFPLSANWLGPPVCKMTAGSKKTFCSFKSVSLQVSGDLVATVSPSLLWSVLEVGKEAGVFHSSGLFPLPPQDSVCPAGVPRLVRVLIQGRRMLNEEALSPRQSIRNKQ